MLMTWVLHGPALLVAWTDWPPLFAWTSTPPTIFPPGGFAIPCRYTLHHPYICPCFWRKHFSYPCFSTFYGMQGFQRTVATKGHCMDQPSLLHGPAPPPLHALALLVPTIFLPGGFAIPCRYTLHHPYPGNIKSVESHSNSVGDS